ncbi:MAG: tripartite tricarboxylate transporter substrate binding protein [Chloroflexota bacterium]
MTRQTNFSGTKVHRTLRTVLLAASIAVLSSCSGGLGSSPGSATFPSKPLTIVVPFAPGSATDIEGRVLASILQKQIKQSVIVTDRAGANTALGVGYLESKPADGYTLLFETDTFLYLVAAGKSPYSLKSLQWVANMSGEPSALAVRSDGPASLQAFVSQVKSKGDSAIGGPGQRAHQDLVASLLMHAVGAKYRWVAFSGGANAETALLGGHVDAVVAGPSQLAGAVKSGKLRLLGISGSSRDPIFPAVPTFQQQGVNVVAYQWRALAVKPGTPKPIVSRLGTILAQVASSPDWKQGWLDKYGNNSQFLTGAKMSAFVDSRYKEISSQATGGGQTK